LEAPKCIVGRGLMQGELGMSSREVLAPMRPEIFKTPVPAMTIFEWRGQVENRLESFQESLDVIAKTGTMV